jgi:DNA polymerase III delta prime subunit
MDKERRKDFVNHPGMIPLIHNYCDRWCERCGFTSRCRVFAMEEEKPRKTATKDIDNQEFWNEISETLQSTLDILREMAEENGVDIDESALEMESENAERERVSENELVKSAEKYMETVLDWFDSSEDLFKGKQEELELKARMELPGSDPEAEAADLNNIVEIIQWYHTLIPAKIHRAFYQSPLDFPVDDDNFPNDADGSAKVALISIDRSIAAWMSMQKHFPEKEEEILDMLIHLDRLRKSLEKAFPKARSFKRPGFDE